MVVIKPCSDPDHHQTAGNLASTEIPEPSNPQTGEPAKEDEGFETASDGEGESDGQDRKPASSEAEEPTPEELQQVGWIQSLLFFFFGFFFNLRS